MKYKFFLVDIGFTGYDTLNSSKADRCFSENGGKDL